jgi:hypothetical protein
MNETRALPDELTTIEGLQAAFRARDYVADRRLVDGFEAALAEVAAA